MASEFIRIWEAPSEAEVGATAEAFLERLRGPTWLRIPGRDRTRSRAFVTLLHGNEPSGLRALHAWIRSGARPAVDLVAFVGSVQAALTLPRFSHRSLPGHRDLNRCFRSPFVGAEGRVACELLERLRALQPEALIDLHNTSGSSPAYGVTTHMDAAREALTSLFARHLILTRIRLGAIMEATADDYPTVTIECGGVRDAGSDATALEGLTRYAAADALAVADRTKPLTLLQDPIRVELRKGAQVAYASAAVPDIDLTLDSTIDQRCFAVLSPGEVLGWLGPAGVEALDARDAQGRERSRELFSARDGRLLAARPLQLLMVTTDPRLALGDCLFYVVLPEQAALAGQEAQGARAQDSARMGDG